MSPALSDSWLLQEACFFRRRELVSTHPLLPAPPPKVLLNGLVRDPELRNVQAVLSKGQWFGLCLGWVTLGTMEEYCSGYPCSLSKSIRVSPSFPSDVW